ncbi:gibberellin-regulated protein 5-like [Miscanthus floridulus]|uniref:gibberellin-regulated protein 5-like n=1 Tax=Miscanthus floridulus TaxID=154761 RepID=UPI0034575E5B
MPVPPKYLSPSTGSPRLWSGSGTGGGQQGRAMAASKVVSILVLAFLLLAAVAFPVSAGPRQQGKKGGGGGNLKPWECSPKCASRCSQTQYAKACLTFCNKCCAKCLCVPPGFYGNKGACPCYNNWKTKEGGPKCP